MITPCIDYNFYINDQTKYMRRIAEAVQILLVVQDRMSLGINIITFVLFLSVLKALTKNARDSFCQDAKFKDPSSDIIAHI